MFDEKLGTKIAEIIENSGSNKIIVYTDYLRIEGFVHICDGRCKGLAEHILTLTDAVVCKLNDFCSCNEDSCDCNDFVCFKYDYFNINVLKIVGFSVIK